MRKCLVATFVHPKIHLFWAGQRDHCANNFDSAERRRSLYTFSYEFERISTRLQRLQRDTDHPPSVCVVQKNFPVSRRPSPPERVTKSAIATTDSNFRGLLSAALLPAAPFGKTRCEDPLREEIFSILLHVTFHFSRVFIQRSKRWIWVVVERLLNFTESEPNCDLAWRSRGDVKILAWAMERSSFKWRLSLWVVFDSLGQNMQRNMHRMIAIKGNC